MVMSSLGLELDEHRTCGTMPGTGDTTAQGAQTALVTPHAGAGNASASSTRGLPLSNLGVSSMNLEQQCVQRDARAREFRSRGTPALGSETLNGRRYYRKRWCSQRKGAKMCTIKTTPCAAIGTGSHSQC